MILSTPLSTFLKPLYLSWSWLMPTLKVPTRRVITLAEFFWDGIVDRILCSRLRSTTGGEEHNWSCDCSRLMSTTQDDEYTWGGSVLLEPGFQQVSHGVTIARELAMAMDMDMHMDMDKNKDMVMDMDMHVHMHVDLPMDMTIDSDMYMGMGMDIDMDTHMDFDMDMDMDVAMVIDMGMDMDMVSMDYAILSGL